MARAAKICDVPGCPNFAPCPDHAPKPWAGSRRTERLRTTSGSRQQRHRRFVLERDALTCHRCGHVYPEAQLICDHVVPLAEGGADDVTNKAACCIDCHGEKVQEEAKRGHDQARS